jgi:hypothetical protein
MKFVIRMPFKYIKDFFWHKWKEFITKKKKKTLTKGEEHHPILKKLNLWNLYEAYHNTM